LTERHDQGFDMKEQLVRMRDEDGATAVEYGIMVALIAIVIIAAVFALGGTLSDNFSNVDACIDNPEASVCPGDGSGDTEGD
jgi:pilus assembly protein Flp/PilA